MPFVAILGAGPLGGALTHSLASRARFDEVRLIDPAGTVAAGKALDIRQAGPCDGSSTRVSGHATLDAAAGAWVLVLADLMTTDGTHPDELAAAHRATMLAPGAVLVCAGASAARLLPRLVGSGSLSPDRLVGSAPAAAASAARALIAAACGLSSREIAVSLREHEDDPLTLVVDWTRSSLRGVCAEHMLTREQRARLDAQLHRGWPPGPLALATVATRTAEAAWFGSRAAQPAWVVDRSLIGRAAGAHGSAALVDLRFAPGGRLERAAAGAPC